MFPNTYREAVAGPVGAQQDPVTREAHITTPRLAFPDCHGGRSAVTTETTTALAALLGLFPPGSSVDPDGELVVGGCRLADLATAWGTPLHVFDEVAVRAQ